MNSDHAPASAAARPAFRLWMVLFTLSWLPLLSALATKSHLALDSSWWTNIETLAPSAVILRVYWFVTIPVVGLGFSIAAFLLLARHPSAARFATAVFAGAIALNVGEIVVTTLVHFQFTTTIGTIMRIPPRDVPGLDLGIAASLGELLYKSSCLCYLTLGRGVGESFGRVTWTGLWSWIRESARDAAA